MLTVHSGLWAKGTQLWPLKYTNTPRDEALVFDASTHELIQYLQLQEKEW